MFRTPQRCRAWPHIDDVPEPGHMARVDGTPHPHANLVQALGDDDALLHPPRETVTFTAIVPYESPVQRTVRRK